MQDSACLSICSAEHSAKCLAWRVTYNPATSVRWECSRVHCRPLNCGSALKAALKEVSERFASSTALPQEFVPAETH